MKISIIIPALNEEEVISRTLNSIQKLAGEDTLQEIIVVDGGSTDRTVQQAESAGAKVVTSPAGRAVQMNYGAGLSAGDTLYFLHADSIPPAGFDRSILQAVRNGYPAGCFQLSFDDDHLLLRCYAWFTRFDVDAFRFGDQSLFVTRKLFAKAGGFREDHLVMEDNEMVRRLKRECPFRIIPENVTTSARKYRKEGILKLQTVFTVIFLGYHFGASQSTLVSWYKKFI